MAQYEEKHKILNESANFLIDCSTEPVANQIKNTLLTLNRRFKELIDGFLAFRQTEVIGKARTEYQAGVTKLQGWLGESADVLSKQVKCIHAELKAYLLELDVSIFVLSVSQEMMYSINTLFLIHLLN